MSGMADCPTWIPIVALALRGADGRWLMHRRPPEKHHGGLWEFPGGKVEPGELPDAALEREIREELGIGLDRERLEPVTFAQAAPHGTAPGIVILLYAARHWTGGDPRALEGGEVAWLTPEQIAPLPKPPVDVTLCSALFRAGSKNPTR